MIKVAALIRRKQGVRKADFTKMWREDHPPLVRQLPGLRRYQQSHPVSHREPWPWDGLAELWFDDFDAVRTAFRSDAADAVRAHEEAFIGSLEWFLVEEQVMFDDSLSGPDAAAGPTVRRRRRNGSAGVEGRAVTTTCSRRVDSTARAVSPDSGRHWADEGAWRVDQGIHRIPLPLPLDGLKAVNVYVIETDGGLVLVDGGWAILEAREQLRRSLKSIGYGFGDITRFLVTHAHRDHFTLATVLGRELGADVALGRGEEPTLDLLTDPEAMATNPFAAVLRTAGALEVAEEWLATAEHAQVPDPMHWQAPTTWLEGDQELLLDPERVVHAVHTPGHTPGHYVFADLHADTLFAGDHVLPTITPSIGFVLPRTELPLRDFLGSLAKVRALPDLRLLPAHGPVAPSTHARVDELLLHHDSRLDLSLRALGTDGCTAEQVARQLPWTRRERTYDELDVVNRGMAAMETLAHLEVLVARGDATLEQHADGCLFRPDRPSSADRALGQ
jgi:uncharacterized protein (TIGR02118 family)